MTKNHENGILNREAKSSSKAAVVSFSKVGRSFLGRPAVLPLDVTIDSGEFVSLLGPSGSGKSTLLKLIAGLDEPDTGSVTTNSFGKKYFKSFVFQEASLLPWRTVLKNAVLPLELTGLEKSLADERARSALARVGLSDALDLYPNQLSGGMKMRASIARALVAEPTLLLLDEPFAALDETTRFRLQEDLRKLWQETKMTTVFVTHSISEAVFLSDRSLIFSARPAKLIADIQINLPAERSKSLRNDPSYLARVQQVTKIFEEGESV